MGHKWGFVTSKMAAVLTASTQECDVYCVCGQGEFGEFYMECVGLVTVAVGKWICCVCQGVYIQMFIILYCLSEHLCCPCLYYTMTSNVLFICVCFFQVKRNERQEKREDLLLLMLHLLF